MMRQMRDATKPIMILAALAFGALIVLEWGADITGQSSGAMGEIGRVNGQPVSYDAYMGAYRVLYDQAQNAQQEPISSQQNRDLEDQAWEQVVTTILLSQELRRRNIAVSDQEINQAAQFSPLPELVSSPVFQDEDGNFSPDMYRQWLANQPPDQLLAIEAYYRDLIPRNKLFRQLSAGLYVSDADLWHRYRDANEMVEVRYLEFDPRGRYDDSDFTVAEGAIREYYDDRQDEFLVPARAEVKFVVLDKTPTAADTAAMEAFAAELREEIAEGADFADVARTESADEVSAAEGGDLGVFASGVMVPAFDSAVFAAPAGSLLGPVRTSFGFHVIEVLERWGADSASARHVLVPFGLPDSTEYALLNLADSLEDLGTEMRLDEAARAAGLEATSTSLSIDFPFLQGAGPVSEGADWAFEEAEVGDVSPVFETSQAFYALELVDKTPGGVLPLDQARAAVTSSLLMDMKLQRAADEGARLLERVAQGEALEAVASEEGLELVEAGPFTRTDFVPTLGRQNAAIGTAFGLRPGEVSGAVSTPINVFIIEQVAFMPADSAQWLEQVATQRDMVIGLLAQARLDEWVLALRASADVVDRRDEVLQPVDEENAQPQMPFLY